MKSTNTAPRPSAAISTAASRSVRALANENGTSGHADPRIRSGRSASTFPSAASRRSDRRGAPDSILIQTDPS
jgi:hypothetical protein